MGCMCLFQFWFPQGICLGVGLLFLPGESHGRRSLEGYSPWGRKESSMTEATWHTTHTYCCICASSLSRRAPYTVIKIVTLSSNHLPLNGQNSRTDGQMARDLRVTLFWPSWCFITKKIQFTSVNRSRSFPLNISPFPPKRIWEMTRKDLIHKASSFT